MAWQVKVKYSGSPSNGEALTIGAEVKSLFNQYVNDNYILSQNRETVDGNIIETLQFSSEQKYKDYREALINAIGGDESKFSNHSQIDIIEQKEV